jgi:ppGpp synthetase/RelA/SpoT-type nucleotidyltranferase
LIPQIDGIPIEVQIRTLLQNVWAEVSEKLADVVDPSIKYGGGPTDVKTLLKSLSNSIAEIEDLEYNLYRLKEGGIRTQLEPRLIEIEERIARQRERLKNECYSLALWFTTNKDQQK